MYLFHRGRIDCCIYYLLSRPETGTIISLHTTAKRISKWHMATNLGIIVFNLKLAILKRFCKIFIMKSRLILSGHKTAGYGNLQAAPTIKPIMPYVTHSGSIYRLEICCRCSVTGSGKTQNFASVLMAYFQNSLFVYFLHVFGCTSNYQSGRDLDPGFAG